MIRDPFYRRIVEGLGGRLDPELFEQCASDVLRYWHPTLVPIRGGGDAGMDGTVADGQGPAFPLICTTEEDVIGNLTRSLDSYVRSGGIRRKVIMATSHQLTPRRRRNLEKRGKEKGFVLLQLYDQAAIADRLYHEPEWCRELLNLTGTPPALSMVPVSTRPLLGEYLVGRLQDLEWLKSTDGDRLLVGEPGSGKTFLLRKLARDDAGLFVVSDNRGEIADAMRTQAPHTVFVDDAHIREELLQSLLQFREESGLNFNLLATCWLGAGNLVSNLLRLPRTKARVLERLNRNQIVEVVQGVGIMGPIELLRELANQAEGLPGLAVTLAYLCLQGDVRAVALGDALSRSVLATMESLVGSRARSILAALAVGGDAGIRMQDVAGVLGIPLADTQVAITSLAAGGVVAEGRSDALTLRPPALRYALVRDMFFAGPASLPIEPLIATAPNVADVAMTLIGARNRGATIPSSFLVEILERVGSDHVWSEYARLGDQETRTVLTLHPEYILQLAHPALEYAPEVAIPLLLQRAIGDHRSLPSTIEHPLRLIEDWVKGSYPATGDALRRRRELLAGVRKWIRLGNDSDVGLHALCLVLHPGFEQISTDPGMGDRITITQGFLTPEELGSVADLWPLVLEIIRTVETPNWNYVLECIENWVYPGLIPIQISEEIHELTRVRAKGMLDDIALLVSDRPGVLRRLRSMAENLGHILVVEIASDFQILYPQEDLNNWKQYEGRQAARVRELALQWLDRDPLEVVNRIATIEGEAVAATITWPRWTEFLCSEIAKRTDRPSTWAQAAIDSGLSADLVSPFLSQAAFAEARDWVTIAMETLQSPRLRVVGISIALTAETVPKDLLEAALDVLNGLSEMVRSLVQQGTIPVDRLRRLLEHPDPGVAGAAAVGEWLSNPSGSVRESLKKEWRRAVIVMRGESHWLPQILSQDSELAREWLLGYVRLRPQGFFRVHATSRTAVEALKRSDRRTVLQALPDDFWDVELVAKLVGNDLDLFRELIATERPNCIRLAPLVGKPTEEWIEKAKIAMTAGFTPQQIASEAYSRVWSGMGRLSDGYAVWMEDFQPLMANADERVREIGNIVRARVERERNRALQREHVEGVRGL